MPAPAPGDAARPVAITSPFFKASLLNIGWSKLSNCFGSTLSKASSFVIIPSFTKSTAIFKAAVAVLLPFLVWSINNLPFSIVNSISCISL